jgi:ribosomal protein L37AE/L43A
MVMAMLRYRIIRGAHEGFVVGLFWIYVVLFAIAMCMVFIFPPGAIMLFFGCLVSLPLAVLGALFLRTLRAGLATTILRSGRCPCCSERMQSARPAAEAWRCEFCDACFHPGGQEEPVSPVAAVSPAA